jgi:hypothetical protein
MRFEIIVHSAEKILEVVYPPSPTEADISDYASRVRQTIDTMGASWSALVDQRQLRELPFELMKTLSGLNAYAQLKGMQRSARVVPDAAAGLKAWRMTKQALLSVPARTFESREQALEWLREVEP